MRCIEMKEINRSEPTSYRLTLTWDVLKWWTACNGIWDRGRLTLTWDVLKCMQQAAVWLEVHD